MARATVRTSLPLDTWARILGINPYHFNSIELDSSPAMHCNKVWRQYAWQDSDRVGREEVAECIAQAEADIRDHLGFFPVPTWTEAEIKRLAQPTDTEAHFTESPADPRLLLRGTMTKWGHVISGGVEGAILIGTATVAGGTLTYTDRDGDGYAETAVIVLPTTVTDTNEVRVYFTGRDREPGYEVRPLQAVEITAPNLTILIPRYLLAEPDLAEAIAPTVVDGDVLADFVTDLEVWRVYIDPSDQGEIQWESMAGSYCGCTLEICDHCTWGAQPVCLRVRSPEQGIVTYGPATFDIATWAFVAAAPAYARGPQRISMNYLSGYQGGSLKRPRVDMDGAMARMVAIYALTLLDRPVCECNNVQGYFDRWREDIALEGDARWKVSDANLNCPWGTKAGAIWAWRQAQRYRLTRAVEL